MKDEKLPVRQIYRVTISCEDIFDVSFVDDSLEDCLRSCLGAIELNEDIPVALAAVVNQGKPDLENESRPELKEEYMAFRAAAERFYEAAMKLH